jgi:hypothetical protein
MNGYQLFPNIGYFQHKFTSDQLSFLKKEIDKIQNNFNDAISFNEKLVGNIENEYSLVTSKDNLEKLILPLIKQYDEHSGILKKSNIMSKSLALYLDTAWVNFQKKYEFNPVHNHEGIISFVLWISIPFDIDLELRNGLGKKSNSNCPGFFEFQYLNSLGQIQLLKIPIHTGMENTLLLFPSSMSHCVYPFSLSDSYRISVSGNFKLLVN